jgi:transposase
MMPFARMRKPLVLSDEDMEKLQRLKASRTEAHSRVIRAEILLAYEAGESVSGIARRVGVSRPTVGLCIEKALCGGIDVALDDLPRSGRPAEKTVEDKVWVVSLACNKPKAYGYAGETWTISQLAQHVRKHAEASGHPSLRKAGKATIQRILKEYKIRPHKIPYYLDKRDPEFEEKMAQVLVVYKEVQQFLEEFPNDDEDPGETTVSYDEKPGIQAIANIVADLAPVPGSHPTWRRDYEYKRLGTVSLLAGIDLYDGHVLGLVRDRHRSKEFIEFLTELDHYYPRDWKIRLVLDNHSTHVSKETLKWLKERPGRFNFVFTPKHASWLNMVEILFSKMTRSFLRGIRVASKQELERRIYQYIREVNDSPVVFRWKYKLDEVLT